MTGRRTVFLDRDGTVNHKADEDDYIRSPDQLVLLDGAACAVRRLNDAGIVVVLVSNQRGIARGLFTEEEHAQVLARLEALLARDGAHLDASYHCPHEVGTCECRKPGVVMLTRAAEELPHVDLSAAAIVGDAESDVAAGRQLGLVTVRIAAQGSASAADHVASSLADAVDWLLSPGQPGQTDRIASTRARAATDGE